MMENYLANIVILGDCSKKVFHGMFHGIRKGEIGSRAFATLPFPGPRVIP
jgi:hypothetical protein